MTEILDGTLFGPGQPCFGCGPDHPIGFRLRFEKHEDHVLTRFTPGERYQGPPGIMHGGLVSTLADEIGAWAVVGLLGKFGFTASMSGRLHQPIRVGEEVVGRGHLERPGTRIVSVGVEIRQGETKCFTGDFRFVLLDRSGAERLLGTPLPDDWERFSRTGG